MTIGDDGRNVIAQRQRLEEVGLVLASRDEQLESLEQRSAELQLFLDANAVDTPKPTSGVRNRLDDAGASDQTYAELTASNNAFLKARGIDGLTLDDVLTGDEFEQLESLTPLGRERWAVSDFVTVGICGALGAVAALFDDQIDAMAKAGLAGIGNTGLWKHFEHEGKRLSIDYTGPGFGGPGHRGRSSGHDIGHPFEALNQIRNGEFRGWEWIDGVRYEVVRNAPPRLGAAPYDKHSLAASLVLWLMHLSADYVTTLGLPLPWWSSLSQCSNRDLRKLASYLYSPGDGIPGINQRSMLMSKSLPVISAEVIVRVKVLLDARCPGEGLPELTPDQKLRRSEMLFSAQAATAGASVGRIITAAPHENVLAIRHLNLPALARAGFLGLRVLLEFQARHKTRRVPTWDELVEAAEVPWNVDELSIIRGAPGV